MAGTQLCGCHSEPVNLVIYIAENGAGLKTKPDMNQTVMTSPLMCIIIADKYRVILSGEHPEYIHAVTANVSLMSSCHQYSQFHHCILQGYKQKKAYIIAEGPMESTARNMWKMIYDRKCGAVIMLSDLTENGTVLLGGLS